MAKIPETTAINLTMMDSFGHMLLFYYLIEYVEGQPDIFYTMLKIAFASYLVMFVINFLALLCAYYGKKPNSPESSSKK